MFDFTGMPSGHPRIKMTRYNWTAYVGKVKWTTFDNEADAQRWLSEALARLEAF